MIRLGVNIDHVATLRQARYKATHTGKLTPEPDLLLTAREVERAGAHGITVHLREDRRHIQDCDVRLLRRAVKTSLNLEMADVPEIVTIAEAIRPDEVCLVPEKRAEVTTEGGLDVVRAVRSLARTVPRLRKAGIAVSLFVDPVRDQIQAAADVGANFVELHTGTYANRGTRAELHKLVAAAGQAHALGLRINAGHGLNYQNTRPVLRLPHLETLNIGHAIVSRAVFVGLRQAVREMLKVIRGMKVHGVGVDIVETKRVEESVTRFGERFLHRCFLPGEIAYCQGMKFPARHFAARFAAKEAISKAFGTGIGAQLGWRDMEICRRDSGEPFVVLHGKGAELAKNRGVTEVLVSLSHCNEYAVAQAVAV